MTQKILSITIDANSSACAMIDGEIVAAISEERFNKIKNYVGYPKQSVEHCFKALGGSVDKILLPSPESDPLLVLTHWTKRDVQERIDEQNKYWYPNLYENKNVHYLSVFPEKLNLQQYPGEKFWSQIDLKADVSTRIKQFKKLRKLMISEHLNVPVEKITFKQHHMCHSYYAYYASPIRNEPVLSFTADGFGDHWCATLRLFDENGKSKVLMQSDEALLGRLYRFVTLNLKMKPLEDEYKVMGLAPYASEYHWRKPYEVFKQLLEVDGYNIKLKNRPKDFFFYYQKKLESFRFDAIAGGLQKYLEDIVVQWVENAIEITGVKNVVFSGGVSMNVKAMMEVSKIKSLEKLHVPPSGADESLCIGAAYHEASKHLNSHDILPLKNAYLGVGYNADEIQKFIVDNLIDQHYNVTNNVSSDQIALELSQGSVIGLFTGKMEFGARALGARSIIADPRSVDTVKRINYKIKNRDFWMPFAPAVLQERVNDYFINEKNLVSSFMTIGFETTDLGKNTLKAAIHSADQTGRPQFVTKEYNSTYYNIIKSFEELTGVGALLNTSFNLHGLPIAMTPEDAMHVLDNSGLDALLIEGFLIKKKLA